MARQHGYSVTFGLCKGCLKEKEKNIPWNTFIFHKYHRFLKLQWFKSQWFLHHIPTCPDLIQNDICLYLCMGRRERDKNIYNSWLITLILFFNYSHIGQDYPLQCFLLASPIVWVGNICIELTSATGPSLTLSIHQGAPITGQPLVTPHWGNNSLAVVANSHGWLSERT